MGTPNHISRRKGVQRGELTITDTYQVQVQTANDISSALADVEAIGAPSGYRQDSIEGRHINRNPMWFEVVATYKIVSGGPTGGEEPLLRPSVLSVGYEEWTEAYDVDHGDPPWPVVNTALLPFESLPQRKAGAMILQITKNYDVYDALYYDELKFTTNASLVNIKGAQFAAKTLLFLPPTAQEVWEQIGSTTHHYVAATFRLAADAGQHLHRVADRGYKELVDGKWNPIINPATGLPTDEPWPLDGEGKAKAAGATPAIVTFVPYASANWGIDFN